MKFTVVTIVWIALSANSFAYAPHGQVERMRLGNGKWETTQFNSSRQITQIGLGHSATNTGFLKINYDYGELQTNGTVDATKNNGNLAKQTITVPTIGATAGFTAIQIYTYDSLDRLKSATEKIGTTETWKQTFNYDRFGNKNFDTGNTSIQSTESSTGKIVNPEVLTSNNRFKEDQDADSQADYLYDTTGNLTKNAQGREFTFDAENLQTTATGTGLSMAYSYDGNNKRVKSHNAVTDQTTIFVYDANGQLSAEYTINVPPPTTPVISYLTEDALGSVRATTNSFGEIKARRDFLPFGEELYAGIANRATNQKYSSGTDDTRKKFATYQRDAETGSDFAQSRYYSPMNGRFTSPDEFKGGPDELFDFEVSASSNPTFYADLTNPQSLNKYQYGYNNPYKFNDPSGHCPPISSCLDKVQEAADYVGIVPKIGDAVDAGNALVSLIRGDTDGAIRRGIAVIPFIGSPISLAMKANKVRKVISNTDKVTDAPKIVTVSAKKSPEAAEHIRDAQKTRPSILTVDRKSAKSNRQQSTSRVKPEKGKDRDEYPPAVTKEGGQGASVRAIDRSDNRSSGASIGNQIRSVKDGEKIQIKVVD